MSDLENAKSLFFGTNLFNRLNGNFEDTVPELWDDELSNGTVSQTSISGITVTQMTYSILAPTITGDALLPQYYDNSDESDPNITSLSIIDPNTQNPSLQSIAIINSIKTLLWADFF